MGIPVNWNADFISIIGGKMQMHFSLRDGMHLWWMGSAVLASAFMLESKFCICEDSFEKGLFHLVYFWQVVQMLL